MGPPSVVALKVGITHGPHFFNGLKRGEASLDPEMLIKQGAMKTFQDAIRLRAPHAGGALGNVLKLQE
jgi:hypothetical protein